VLHLLLAQLGEDRVLPMALRPHLAT
jgi:hypothetical protein